MKVLVLATTYPHHQEDNVPRFVHDLLLALRQHDYSFTVLVPARPNEVGLPAAVDHIPQRRITYFLPRSRQILTGRGAILDAVKESILARVQAPFLFLAMLFAALREIKKTRYDVINSHWALPSGLIGAIAAKLLGIRHVASLHAGDVAGLAKLPMGRAISRFILANSVWIVPVSAFTAQAFSDVAGQAAGARLHVIPMGVKRSERLEVSRPTRQLLYIGRLAKKKGVDVLLQAMVEVRRQERGAKLVIVGNGPERSELEMRCRQLGLSDAVNFTGFLPRADRDAFLAARPVFVLPSIATQSGDVEGMPVVLMEALASGCCVVASAVGGIPEVLEHEKNGLLVPPARPKELAAAILRTLTDTNLRQALADAGFRTSARFDWSRVSAEYDALLRAG